MDIAYGLDPPGLIAKDGLQKFRPKGVVADQEDGAEDQGPIGTGQHSVIRFPDLDLGNGLKKAFGWKIHANDPNGLGAGLVHHRYGKSYAILSVERGCVFLHQLDIRDIPLPPTLIESGLPPCILSIVNGWRFGIGPYENTTDIRDDNGNVF